jgi:hypothetical protein
MPVEPLSDIALSFAVIAVPLTFTFIAVPLAVSPLLKLEALFWNVIPAAELAVTNPVFAVPVVDVTPSIYSTPVPVVARESPAHVMRPSSTSDRFNVLATLAPADSPLPADAVIVVAPVDCRFPTKSTSAAVTNSVLPEMAFFPVATVSVPVPLFPESAVRLMLPVPPEVTVSFNVIAPVALKLIAPFAAVDTAPDTVILPVFVTVTVPPLVCDIPVTVSVVAVFVS